jgi:hemolysin activation/secretion protein
LHFESLLTRLKRKRFLLLFSLCSLTQLIGQEPTRDTPYEINKAQEPFYKISRLDVEYIDLYEGLPDIDFLLDADLYLEKTEDGFTAPKNIDNLYKVRLSEIQDLSPDFSFSRTALRLITRRVVEQINKKGIIGIYAYIDFDQITPRGKDLRSPNDLSLKIMITASTVSSIKALQAGADITDEETWEEEEELKDSTQSLFERIYRLSPVQIAETDSDQVNPIAGSSFGPSLIQKGLLQDYLYFINRHPGRRVDLKIKPEENLEASIFFLVLEGKPWRVSYNTSNVSKKWVNQLDFVHYQLTNNDDIFKSSIITNDFSSFKSFVLSYEAPFFDSVRNHWKLHWSGSEYDASIGIFKGDPEPEFSGEQFSIGAQYIGNIYQHKEFFFDFVFDTTFKNIKTRSKLITEPDGEGNDVPRKGKGHFVVPNITFKASKVAKTHSFFAGFTIERALPTYGKDLYKLNRGDELDGPPDKAVTFYKINTNLSFYLEPLWDTTAWSDTSTPDSSTLAHEVQMLARVQYSPNRLIPQFKNTVGGPSSVRGYPQGVASGDSAYIASIEYRLHVPRLFSIQSNDSDNLGSEDGDAVSSFKWAPSYVYDRPDWDCVIKTFMDYGRTISVRRTQTILHEANEELWSIGLGIDLLFKSNIQLKTDWGIIQKPPVKRKDLKIGYSRWHINLSAIF